MSELIDTNTATGARIRYKIVRNGAASKVKGEDVNTAVVLCHRTYTLRDCADELVDGRKVAVSRSLVNYVLSELTELVQDLLAQGNSVNLGGIVVLRPTIKGTFSSGDDEFTRGEHQITIAASAGKVLRHVAALSAVERVSSGVPFPVVTQLLNATDGASEYIYSQGNAVILGKALGFDAAANDEGLFVELNGMETKCDIESANAERIYFRVKNTFSEDGEEAVLIFKTRRGQAEASPIRITKSFTTKVAQ